MWCSSVVLLGVWGLRCIRWVGRVWRGSAGLAGPEGPAAGRPPSPAGRAPRARRGGGWKFRSRTEVSGASAASCTGSGLGFLADPCARARRTPLRASSAVSRCRGRRDQSAPPASTHGTGSSQRMSDPLTASDSTRIQTTTMLRKAMPITRWPMLIGCRPRLRPRSSVGCRCAHARSPGLGWSAGGDGDVADFDLDVEGQAGTSVPPSYARGAGGRRCRPARLPKSVNPPGPSTLPIARTSTPRGTTTSSSPTSPLTLDVRPSRFSGSATWHEVELVLAHAVVVGALPPPLDRLGVLGDGVGVPLLGGEAGDGGDGRDEADQDQAAGAAVDRPNEAASRR